MRIIIAIILFACSHCLQAQSYTAIDKESSIGFRIKNFGVYVDGTFSGLQGNIKFNPSILDEAEMKLSVKSSSVDTGIALRNKHLKKEDFFNAEKYPLLTFTLNQVSRGPQSDTFLAKGFLTIKNKTMEITIPFKAITAPGSYMFEGRFSIDRREYGVGGSSLTMGDEVEVTFQIRANVVNGSTAETMP